MLELVSQSFPSVVENWGRRIFGPGALLIFLTWHLAESSHYIYSSSGCTMLFRIYFALGERNQSQNILAKMRDLLLHMIRLWGDQKLSWPCEQMELETWMLSGFLLLHLSSLFLFVSVSISQTSQSHIKGSVISSSNLHLYSIWKKKKKKTIFFLSTPEWKFPWRNNSDQAGWIPVPVSWSSYCGQTLPYLLSNLYSGVALLVEEGRGEEGLKRP